MTDPASLAAENLLLRRKLDRAMRDMRLLEEAKDRYDALYAHAVASLLESGAKYRNLAESLSEGLVMTDPALRLTYFNPGFSAIFGYGPKDPPPATLEDVAPEGGTEAFRDHFLNGPPAAPGSREFTLRRRNGTPVEVLLSAVALRDANPARAGFLVLFTDISAHKRVTETQRYAQKMESLVLMAGSIAHDFNNIFQAIISSLEIAAHHARDLPQAVRPLEGAQGALRRAIALSLQMMDFSGLVIARRRRVFLPEMLAQWFPELAPAPENRFLEMAFGKAPTISADPANLRKVVDAILQNAWEAMDEAATPLGRVRMTVHLDHGTEAPLGFWAAARPKVPETVCLEIGNDGPCPPPWVQRRMFDPFFTTKTIGRGLGLASALGLLQAQGAGVQVLPGKEGGIRFRLHFPPADQTEDLPVTRGTLRAP